MKKYLYSFKLYFLTSFEYRFNTVMNVIMSNLGLFVTIAFWEVIYKSNGVGLINGYSIKDMTTYFVISTLFQAFILNSAGFEMATLVKNGGLSSILLKPYSINIFLYFKNLSNALIGFIQQFVFLIIVILFFIKYVNWNLSFKSFVILLIFLVISSIISYLVWLLFGLIAFWITEVYAVMWSLAVILNFLSGAFIPLDLFPSWSVKIMELMPFAVFSYIPAKIYMNQLSMERVMLLFLVYTAWAVALTFINSIVWKIGIKKYSGVGA